METVIKCDLCGSSNQECFETYRRNGEVFNLVECTNCGLAFLNPRPTIQEIGRYYDETYTNIHRVYSIPLIQRFFLPFIKTLLRARYSNSQFGRMIMMTLFYPLELKWQSILKKNYLNYIHGIGRILDVGCGRGAWLSSMRRWGFDCYGCEPDSRAAAVASQAGIKICNGDLQSAKYPDAYFDVVHFSHVLEHVHSPSIVLTEAKRILAANGVLIIKVPNHAGISCQAFRCVEDVPRHLYSFSPDTLRMYLEKVDMQPQVITTHTDTYSIYSHLFHSALSMIDANIEDAEIKLEKARWYWSHRNLNRHREFRSTARYFDSIGHGSTLIAVAVKQ